MSARLAAWCLLVLAFGQEVDAACEQFVAREGDVTVRCEGAVPDWGSLPTGTNGVEVRGLQMRLLTKDFLAGHALPQLTHLYLPHNQVEAVSENATAGLSGLLTLDLSHNRLRRLDAGALAGSPRLRTLVLSHNHLLALGQRWAFLLPLTHLTHLQMRHCSLSSVPDEAVKMLSQTASSVELDARGNPDAGLQCRSLLQRMRHDAKAPRLLCDAARDIAGRRPPAPLVILWCVVAIVCAATALGCLWRWRYEKGPSATVPYRRFFLTGSEKA